MSYSESTKEIGIVVTDFDYDGLQQELRDAIEDVLDQDIERGTCCLDAKGHDECAVADYKSCPNVRYDECNAPYCAVSLARKLSAQKESYRFLPSMVKYYWQNGLDEEAVEFLKHSEFVTRYQYVATDKFCDAAKPYGKTVYAFAVVEGWHVRYMLCLFVAGVLCSIIVVPITIAISQSLEVGLTAGSYSLGIATVLLAVFTFLSAIL
ncbi:hypothetical protein BDV10DRAFT_189179 [Aspergillus recurvatus]